MASWTRVTVCALLGLALGPCQAAELATGVQDASSRGGRMLQDAVAIAPAPAEGPLVDVVCTYTIMDGDFVDVVALERDCTEEDIIAANPGLDPSTISEGDVIFLPPGCECLDDAFGPMAAPGPGGVEPMVPSEGPAGAFVNERGSASAIPMGASLCTFLLAVGAWFVM